jgi:hypothetical protein
MSMMRDVHTVDEVCLLFADVVIGVGSAWIAKAGAEGDHPGEGVY